MSLSLVLQPFLLASLSGCATPAIADRVASEARAPHVMASMTGGGAMHMDMHMDMSAPAPTESSSAPEPLRDCETDDTNPPCDRPGMPVDCAAMSACGSPPLVMVALASTSDVATLLDRTPAPLALRAGIAASPESPPPRV
ncbi:MAG: hypothetical protein ABMA00_05275 [Gemmatimonas sp.]